MPNSITCKCYWHNFKYFTEQTAYIDVCDDTDYSWRAKGFHEQAKSAGVPAITTAGIYPGVSNGLHIPSIQFLRLAFCFSFCCPGSSSSSLECSTQIFFISRRDKYLDFSEFINVLYCSLLTVMAAELVDAARSENDGELERLRLEFVIVYTKPNIKIQCI